MAYGQNSNIGIAFQNSYGTAADVGSIHFVPHLSDTVALDIPPMYSENMRGIIDEGDTYEGKRTIGGDLETQAQPIALGAILKTVLEEVSVINSGGIYTRTFKPRTSDFDELSANNPFTHYQFLDTGSAMLHSDMNGGVLELGIANGEFLKAKTTMVGGTFSQVAQVSASYPVGKHWTWDVASVSLGGAGIDEIADLTITLDDGGVEAMHTLNQSKYPSRIKRTAFRTLAVAGTIKFDNQTEYQKFINQTEQALIMHFEGVTQIQSGYYESVTIKLPSMRYEEMKPAAGGVGQIEVSLSARGKYSVTSGTALEVTHVSTQVAY